MEIISLKEYQLKKIKLLKTDVKILLNEFKDKIQVYKDVDDEDLFIIQPLHYTGNIILNNVILNINPKININNLFYMLSYTYNLPFFDINTLLDSNNSGEIIFETLVKIFNNYISKLIDRGIYRGYEENLNLSLTKNGTKLDKIYCNYANLSLNVLENRILRSTLYMLSTYNNFRDSQLSHNLRKFFNLLQGISFEDVTLSSFKEIKYNRLNEYYKQILILCRLFIENKSLQNQTITNNSQDSGIPTINFHSFLLDTKDLFKKFIIKYIKESFEKNNFITSEHNKIYFYTNKNSIKPDILIKVQQAPYIIINIEYKPPLKDQDVKQILNYCKTNQIKKALLVYPQDVNNEIYVIKDQNITIKRYILNLTREKYLFLKELRNFLSTVKAEIKDNQTNKNIEIQNKQKENNFISCDFISNQFSLF